MTSIKNFDVIIIGGSYAGLAAGMALGRSLKQVLIIDGGMPCNIQTPYSHNFITQDGRTPLEIAILAKCQVGKYGTVKFFHCIASKGLKTATGFEIETATGEVFNAGKLVFATGIKDVLPQIAGFAECWGISVLHCPFCHGYEVRNETTGIMGNGDYGFEFSMLISNWTSDLTLYTNDESTLTKEQSLLLEKNNIKTVETPIEKLEHHNGHLQKIMFRDGSSAACSALYLRNPFEQNCSIPEALGCELTEEGYIRVDALQRTTVEGVFACGDNSSRMRTLANAVAMGTTAGITVSKELVMERFRSTTNEVAAV